MSVAARADLVVATRNDHKLVEFGRLLEQTPLHPLPDGVAMPPEDGSTYAENALTKARAAVGATGRTAIADDSGVEAQALGGAPGVRSARFAGEEATDAQNLAKLHAEAPAGTRLRYVCVLAHVTPDGEEQVFEGICDGAVAPEPRGSGGFGYDPIFLPDDPIAAGRTMAELADVEKDAISHRGRAARALLHWLSGDDEGDGASVGRRRSPTQP